MRKRRRTSDPGWGFVLLIAALVGSLAMGLARVARMVEKPLVENRNGWKITR